MKFQCEIDNGEILAMIREDLNYGRAYCVIRPIFEEELKALALPIVKDKCAELLHDAAFMNKVQSDAESLVRANVISGMQAQFLDELIQKVKNGKASTREAIYTAFELGRE